MPGKLSGDIQIQAQDANGIKINTDETIDLEFSSTSSTGEFLNENAESVKTVMSKGTANRYFNYRDATSGSHALKVKAKGRESGLSWTASQTITVSSNVSVPSSSSATAPSPVPVPAPPSLPPVPVPAVSSNSQIHVDAGPDQTVTVGSLVEFKGTALGLKKEPLPAARFWWNFGDGETQEGKATDHIFRIPGTYIVGLHVSSGEYSSSDYATVRVLENQMRIGRVVSGGEGYIRLANPFNMEVDIGDWIIEDESHKRFFVPPKTKITAGGDVSFSNAVTGLLAGKEPHSLAIQYPNGTIAFTYAVPLPAPANAGISESNAASALPASPAVKILSEPSAHVSPSGVPSKSTAEVPDKASGIGKPEPQTDAVSKNTFDPHENSAALAVGFSVSSRMMFAGAVGLSVFGALGFFIIKNFLL